MHVAEGFSHHSVACHWMAQHRPIGAGNIAAPDGLVPKPVQRDFIPGLGELPDRSIVAPVKSAFWMNFPPPCGLPASATPCLCKSWSLALSAPWTPSLISRRRISTLERQVPMIEQCTLACICQIG